MLLIRHRAAAAVSYFKDGPLANEKKGLCSGIKMTPPDVIRVKTKTN
jgi:hypothetical protein